MDLKARVLEVLENAHLLTIATTDSIGLWAADVVFVHDDNLAIYWMSHEGTRHSKAIENNPNVAGTITVSTASGQPSFGIQISGEANKVDGPRYDLAVKHLPKRGYPVPKEDDDVLMGGSWYMLTPTKIQLVDFANFGYEPKNVPL